MYTFFVGIAFYKFNDQASAVSMVILPANTL
jgi:hypothetical protein